MTTPHLPDFPSFRCIALVSSFSNLPFYNFTVCFLFFSFCFTASLYCFLSPPFTSLPQSASFSLPSTALAFFFPLPFLPFHWPIFLPLPSTSKPARFFPLPFPLLHWHFFFPLPSLLLPYLTASSSLSSSRPYCFLPLHFLPLSCLTDLFLFPFLPLPVLLSASSSSPFLLTLLAFHYVPLRLLLTSHVWK